MKLKEIKIGKLKVHPVLLAPMVDVTDSAYRQICKKYGAGLVFTEMLNIGSIINENERTEKLMKFSSKERPIGIQITGRNEDEFNRVLPYLKKYDLVDINCGCPSIRITDNESGSYLLKNPEKIASFIKILKKQGLVVTAKIRLGFKKNNVIKIAKEIEKAGADAITVHARLSHEGSSVPADWKWISKVKKAISIPVIANGDIFTGEDVLKVFKETGCDGVMIARGAIGNPRVFKQINEFIKSGKTIEISAKDKMKDFYEYLKLARKLKVLDMSRVKYLGGQFITGFNGAAKTRNDFMKISDFDEIEEFVYNLSKKI